MSTLFELSQRASTLNNPRFLELTLFVEIKEAEKHFIKAQKKQLSEGEDYNGETIGIYKESTENWERDYVPRQPKIAGTPYNFEDTGLFYDSMVFDIYDTGTLYAEFWSTDSKTPELVQQYKGLFGLQDEALKEIISTIIYPAFMREIRKVLKLD